MAQASHDGRALSVIGLAARDRGIDRDLINDHARPYK
jgi:hypothetical protein